jgi:hypothetical protein
MAKWKYVHVVQGNYGQGWEDVTEEETYPDAFQRLKEYNQNETQIAHRMIVRREKVESAEEIVPQRYTYSRAQVVGDRKRRMKKGKQASWG